MRERRALEPGAGLTADGIDARLGEGRGKRVARDAHSEGPTRFLRENDPLLLERVPGRGHVTNAAFGVAVRGVALDVEGQDGKGMGPRAAEIGAVADADGVVGTGLLWVRVAVVVFVVDKGDYEGTIMGGAGLRGGREAKNVEGPYVIAWQHGLARPKTVIIDNVCQGRIYGLAPGLLLTKVLRSSSSSSARMIGFFFSVRNQYLMVSCCLTCSPSARDICEKALAYSLHLALDERIDLLTACLFLSH